MRKIITILLVLWLLLNVAFADVIKNYHVDVTVLEDGKIDVVETIEVDTEFKEIKLGITREIPLHYLLDNRNVETPTRIMSITRNGHKEPYYARVLHDNNLLRTRENDLLYIAIGEDKDERKNYINFGRNVYQIHWQSYHHIRQFKDYDELYFNAIGHNWRLPIEKASVTVHLPKKVGMTQSTSYYGYSGAIDQIQGLIETPQTIHFSSPEKLGRKKGMTVAVGFEKGLNISQALPPFIIINDGMWRIQIMDIVVVIPVWMQSLLWLTVVIFIYTLFGRLCIKVMERRSRKIFMVRYEPSTTLMETMALSRHYPYSDKLITAELVGLHANGYIQLQKKGFQLLKDSMSEVRADQSLSVCQQRFLFSIKFAKAGDFIRFRDISEESLKDIFIRPYQTSLSLYYESMFENPIMKWLGSGIYLLVPVVLIILPSTDLMTYIMMGLMLIIVSQTFYPASMVLLYAIFRGKIILFFSFLIPSAMIYGFGVFASIIIMFFINMTGSTILRTGSIVGLIAIWICICMVMLWIYNSFIKIQLLNSLYKDKRRAVYEFRHFLAYTKAHEYELLTADLFDEYLPYAIVLGVEKKWVALYRKLYPEVVLQSQSIDILDDINSIGALLPSYNEDSDHALSMTGSSTSGSGSSGFLGGISGSFGSSSGGGSSSGSGGGGSSGGGSGGGGGGGR